MWLAMPVVVLIVLAILGGLLVAGIYAIVLLPIAAVVLIVGLILIWRRANDPQAGADRDERTLMPLGGGSGHVNDAARPSTPDEILNARREVQ